MNRAGAIVDELPYVYINLQYRALIFRPVCGAVLRGVVARSTEWSVACLVYGTFNATLFAPRGLKQDSDWLGFALDEGDEVTFHVTGMEESKGTVNLRGRIADQTEVDSFEKETPSKK
eukprot:m.2398 g.2398  ORF g.2398 m.2398 type:complete len:118 (+) comp8632_c0_seq1:210-563(+)